MKRGPGRAEMALSWNGVALAGVNNVFGNLGKLA